MIQIDMDMPERCGQCRLFHAENPMHCTVIKGYKTVGAPYGMPRPEWCPLKEESDKIDRQSVLNLLRVMKDEFNSVHEAYQTLGDAIMRMDG